MTKSLPNNRVEADAHFQIRLLLRRIYVRQELSEWQKNSRGSPNNTR